MLEGKCYEECPVGTAPDMINQKCFRCTPRCSKCTSPEKGSCVLCDVPYLLEDGLCKSECENEGYFPNAAGTLCINKTEFPTIGPIFSIMTILIFIIVLICKFALSR